MNRLTRLHSDEEVGEMVLGYLARFPDAEDTLAGIADWWIPQQRIHVGVEQLGRVLQELSASGAVERVGDGPRQLYRLRRTAAAEMTAERRATAADEVER